MTILKVEKLTRTFGTTKALVNCHLAVEPGTVHAILGENGSGKSTLVKILSGVQVPDSGTVTIEGERVRRFTPHHLQSYGIATVFQEILNVPNLSVLDNLYLGYDPPFGKSSAPPSRRSRANDLLARLTDETVDLDSEVGRLPLQQSQLVAIGRALIREPRIMILDEATSALGVDERNRLYALIAQLTQQGIAIIYITHRMNEVLDLADVVTVLRNGENVAQVPRSRVSAQRLLRLMSPEFATLTAQNHRDESAIRTISKANSPEKTHAAPVIQVRNAKVREKADALDLDIHAGEIVGLAGLDGHGHEELLRSMAGLHRPISGTVTISANGRQEAITSLGAANRAGVVYVPRDRKTEGIFPTLSVLDNFGVAIRRRVAWLGTVIRWRDLRSVFSRFVASLSIDAGPPKAAITTLSGGSQQKVILARWLAHQPRVILLNDPTRGVDVASRLAVHSALDTAARNGAAIVVLSTDLEELSLLCDRILVFHNGSLSAQVFPPDVSATRIVAAMFGADHE